MVELAGSSAPLGELPGMRIGEISQRASSVNMHMIYDKGQMRWFVFPIVHIAGWVLWRRPQIT